MQTRPTDCRNLFVAALLAILALGCASSSEVLDPSFVQQIHVGQKRAEVMTLLGTPNLSRGGPGGWSADTYLYTEVVNSASSAASSARDFKVRAFSVRYDASGTVRDTLFNESRTPMIVLRGAAYAGPTTTPQDVSRIHIGSMTRAKLNEFFGKPLVVNLHAANGIELHWYQIAVGASATQFEREQGLHVIVDDNGIARHAEFSDNTDRQR